MRCSRSSEIEERTRNAAGPPPSTRTDIPRRWGLASGSVRASPFVPSLAAGLEEAPALNGLGRRVFASAVAFLPLSWPRRL
jgi:hypothetical protein